MKTALKVVLPLTLLAVTGAVTTALILTRPKVKPAPREAAVPLVRVVPATAQSHRFTVRTHGTVTPRTDIQLAAEVSGRIVAVAPSFAAGGFFESGEVLVTLDARDYELALTRAQAALAEAQVRLQREEAEAQIARKEWQALGAAEKPNPLLLREPQLAEARAAVASATALVRTAELDLERCQIKAPFAGRVWSKRVDVGQFLAKGEQVARIYAVDYAEVRLPIVLDDLAFLDLPLEYRGEVRGTGPEVLLRGRVAGQTHEWRGRIVRTEGEVDPRTRMLTAVARVEDPYGRRDGSDNPPLAVGLFVEAEIRGHSIDHVFVIPRAAVYGREGVKVIDADGRLRLQPVEVLRAGQTEVVVRRGLEEGDLVCISPLDTPVDGMRVRVAETIAQEVR